MRGPPDPDNRRQANAPRAHTPVRRCRAERRHNAPKQGLTRPYARMAIVRPRSVAAPRKACGRGGARGDPPEQWRPLAHAGTSAHTDAGRPGARARRGGLRPHTAHTASPGRRFPLRTPGP
ncbi:hypothetical protein GCM10027570_10260 [Streptomonospora sediminis]